MFALVIPIGLIIGGGVAYHLAIRAAAGASPWAVLTPAYGLAFLVCAGLWARAGHALAVPARGVLAVAGVLALSLVAIEGGYFLAYRSGWAMSNATALTNTVIVAALAVVGVVMLGERLNGLRAIGLVIAAVGVWMVVRGQRG
ncbi:MAG: hypothetical protein IPL61_17840 [Myxococcales bacterium]|nr:hypothetical protein [Myxococcales bacterium]